MWGTWHTGHHTPLRIKEDALYMANIYIYILEPVARAASVLASAEAPNLDLSPRSWIENPGPCIQDPRSRLMNPGSSIQAGESWVQDPGSRIWIQNHWFLGSGQRMSLKFYQPHSEGWGITKNHGKLNLEGAVTKSLWNSGFPWLAKALEYHMIGLISRFGCWWFVWTWAIYTYIYTYILEPVARSWKSKINKCR